MAPRGLAEGLAATYYATALIPNPTLDADSDPEALAAYQATGRDLAAPLLDTQRRRPVRCPCGTREARGGRPARVIATLHGRNLLVVREHRGYVEEGLRLLTHLLVDLPLARREGFHSVRVWCYDCGALHELGFDWLQRLTRSQVSTPCDQLRLAPWGQPVASGGTTPRHANDAAPLAFARVTGPLQGPTVIVTLPTWRAFDYRNHFGFRPPHEDHLLRLVAAHDPRAQEPGIPEMLIPQWRRLELDPEERALVTPEGPADPEDLRGLASFLRTQEPSDHEDDLATLRHMLEPQDYATLQQLLSEEPQ